MRPTCGLMAVLLVLSAVRAGEPAPTGNWKLSVFEDGQERVFWLLRLESKDGKLTGTLDHARDVLPSTLQSVEVKNDTLRFTIKMEDQIFDFEGKIPKAAGATIRGSLARARLLIPAQLEPTQAKSFRDPIYFKEVLAKQPDSPQAFEAALELIREAAANKATLQEAREWANLAFKQAEPHGPRWQHRSALRIAEAAGSQQELLPLALAAAQKAEALLGPKAEAEAQLRTLGVLAQVLKKSSKTEAYQALQPRLDSLEEQAYQEHAESALAFKPEKSAERKGKSERAILVELFTGAQCPPCVAADLAFDGLEKSYRSSEVVLLQYHLHIPGPDALTNADTEARQEFYGEQLQGTPAIFFNGKPAAAGGGERDDAEDKYKEYRNVIDSQTDKPATCKIQAQAVRKGNKVQISAEVSELDKPGEKVRLRLALVEDWVRYSGRNGLSYHHRVVRAMPGRPAGLALAKKTERQTAVVDLDELRQGLNKYLDEFARSTAAFADGQRPMRLRDLRVVAFVQDDATREVLQAVEVPVEAR